MTSWSQQLLLVMLGGALGAGGRYWLGSALLRQFGNGIPWGTLAANLIGSFLAGFLVVWLENRGHAALYWRAFLIIGVMGQQHVIRAVVAAHSLEKGMSSLASGGFDGELLFPREGFHIRAADFAGQACFFGQ